MSIAALLYCNEGCPGIVSHFGAHGMTKELQRQRQKWMRWCVLTIFSHERGRSRFCKRLYTHDRYSVELKSISELCYVFAVVSIVCNSDSLFVNLVLARPCNSSPVHDRVSYHESIFERPTLVRNSNFGVCTTGHGHSHKCLEMAPLKIIN